MPPSHEMLHNGCGSSRLQCGSLGPDLSFESNFVENASTLGAAGLSAWFASWGLRHRLKADIPPDRRAKVCRWLIVSSCWLIGSIPIKELATLRIAPIVLGLLFLCWPNLAVRLIR